MGRRGPGSEWILRLPKDVRAALDAAVDDDADGRRESAKAIWERLGLHEMFGVSLRSVQGYCTLRRARRDNAAVGSLVKAMVGGEQLSLDDVHAIAMGKLAATITSGKLKGYELARCIAAINQSRRTDVVEAEADRRRIEFEEKREAAVEEIVQIGKRERLDKRVLAEIKEKVYGISSPGDES